MFNKLDNIKMYNAQVFVTVSKFLIDRGSLELYT